LPADVLAGQVKTSGGPDAFTKEQAIALLDKYIVEFSTSKYQQMLWKEFPHNEDLLEKGKRVEAISMPVRISVIEQFGFEGNRRGYLKSERLYTSELMSDPQIKEKDALVTYLMNPEIQKERDGESAGPDMAAKAGTLKTSVEAHQAGKPVATDSSGQNLSKAMSKTWKVAGGESTNGILVREGEDLASPKCATRLATGAVVEEVRRLGNRLHFTKLNGEGPMSGWVSIDINGKVLMTRP